MPKFQADSAKQKFKPSQLRADNNVFLSAVQGTEIQVFWGSGK